MAQPKKARGGFPYLWAIAGFCLVGVIAFVIRLSSGTEAYDLKVRQDRLARLEEIQKAADEKLAGYRWADQEKKIVALPIERAMELTVTELKGESVGPSEVKAVSTGSMIVPPYLKPAASEQEQPAGEAAPAPAEAGTEATPAPAGEATPEATAPASGEAPAAPAAPTEPAAAPAPQSPSQPAAAGEATPEAATETPSAPAQPTE